MGFQDQPEAPQRFVDVCPGGGETPAALLGATVFALGPLAQATGWLPGAVAGSALAGIGLPWTVVAAFTAVQRHTPPALLGAVTGSATTLVFAPPALGLPLGALFVAVADHRIPLAPASAAALGVAAHVLWQAPQVRTGMPGEVA